MRLPRDLSGAELAKALERMGYQVTRQTGSHMRLITDPRLSITSPVESELDMLSSSRKHR